MKRDYFLYMAEANGLDSLVSTREARINGCINDFLLLARQGTDINDVRVRESVFTKHKIYDITRDEMKYIARQVERRF
jgi:hypothetical protein